MCMCAEVTEVYDTMSCLPIVSDRAATEGSKYRMGLNLHRTKPLQFSLFLKPSVNSLIRKYFAQNVA